MIEIKNPRYANVDKTLIDCEINHSDYGWISFTASPQDSEAHGREIFAYIMQGKAGVIEDYAPPGKDYYAAEVRSTRNELLLASDKYVLPDRWFAMDPQTQNAWTVYRQALRDIPLQEGFPFNIVWPEMPNKM